MGPLWSFNPKGVKTHKLRTSALSAQPGVLFQSPQWDLFLGAWLIAFSCLRYRKPTTTMDIKIILLWWPDFTSPFFIPQTVPEGKSVHCLLLDHSTWETMVWEAWPQVCRVAGPCERKELHKTPRQCLNCVVKLTSFLGEGQQWRVITFFWRCLKEILFNEHKTLKIINCPHISDLTSKPLNFIIHSWILVLSVLTLEERVLLKVSP